MTICHYCGFSQPHCACNVKGKSASSITFSEAPAQKATLDFEFVPLHEDPEHFRFGFTWKFRHMEIPCAWGRN